MKKTLSLTICLILVISSVTSAYAEIGSGETGNVDSSSTKVVQNSMVLELDKVNLYSPIKFTNEYDDFYSYEIFDLLFNYGDVNIIINEVGEENIVEDSLLITKYKPSLIQLKPNTKYVYDISVMQDDFFAMTFYGEITTGETIKEPVYCELLKLRDNIKARSKIDPMAVIREIEPNNTFETANLINSEVDMYGTISTVLDKDVFKIKYTNSGRADFWLGNISNNSNLDLYLYNESQQLIASSKNVGSSQELLSKQVVVGGKWYYIRVVPANDSVNIPSSYQVSAKFFEVAAWPAEKKQINYCYKCPAYTSHIGVDIASKNDIDGDNIYAILSGTVLKIEKDHSQFGNYIVITHSGDNPLYDNSYTYISSRYAHLSEIISTIKEGDSIRKGDIIGKMGHTPINLKMGTHLHLEIMQHNNIDYNPNLVPRVTINPGKNFYPELKCVLGCNLYPIVPYNFNSDIYKDSKNVGIWINNNYFIDILAFKDITTEELQNYGINSKDLKMFAEIIQDNIEFSEYIDYIYNLINMFEN
jgi:murein DD-endopeptidase MepM/ murein hydrolase activator NlpD